jgi:phospholipid/cholesterol/gamma-HCH transport system substrate-binding protein
MSTTSRKRAVTVGIFTLLGLIIFIAGILLLGGQQRTFQKKMKVKALFDNVGGLQEGNNVWFSGVKVGTVDKIKFISNSQVEVTMNIEQQIQKYIRRNAKARISSEGFIGNKIVEIFGGTMNRPIIENEGVLGVERALSTDEIMATLQQNNLNLLAITNNFKDISKRLSAGEGSVGKLLNDQTLANSLESTAISLKLASSNAQRFATNMSEFSSRLQTKGSLANDLVTDTVVFSRLRATAQQMEEVSNQATNIANDLKNASSNLSGTNTPLGALLNDQETAQNLKLTLRNLQSGTEKLDENMEALQHNFLLRGFFRKKAKKEAAQVDSSPEANTSLDQSQSSGLDSTQRN